MQTQHCSQLKERLSDKRQNKCEISEYLMMKKTADTIEPKPGNPE